MGDLLLPQYLREGRWERVGWKGRCVWGAADACWQASAAWLYLQRTSCVVRIDRHALEALLHVLVVEVVVDEAGDGVVGGDAGFALVPAVKRHQRHSAVHYHQGGAYGG